MAIGNRLQNGGSQQPFAVKYDSDLAVQWEMRYGGFGATNQNFFEDGVELPSGNMILSFRSNGLSVGGIDYGLLKIDANGNILAAKTYGDTGEEWVGSMKLTDNNANLIVSGATQSYGAGDYDGLVFKVDTSLNNVLWAKTYGGSGSDDRLRSRNNITALSDGGFILTGTTSSFGASDAGWILRIDANGNAGTCEGTDITLNSVARTLTAVNASFTNVNRTNTALTVLSPVVQTASQTCCEPEICNDGIDNDGDGLADCLDTDCPCAEPTVGSCYLDLGSGSDEVVRVVAMPDGNFAQFIKTTSIGAGGWDAAIRIVDANNTEIDFRTYGGANDNEMHNGGLGENNQGFIWTGIAGNNNRQVINSIDTVMNSLWRQSVDDSNSGSANDIKEFYHRNGFIYAFGDATYTTTGNNTHATALKLNAATGARIVFRTRTDPTSGWALSYRGGIPTNDGGFLAIGNRLQNGGSQQPFAVKYDSDLAVQWEMRYGGFGATNQNFFEDGVELPSGNMILSFRSNGLSVGGIDYGLLKIDANGNILAAKTYGETGEESVGSMKLTDNNANLIVSGATQSYGAGDYDGLVFKVDTSLNNVLWAKTYGGSGSDDRLRSHNNITALSDGGFIITGTTSSFGSSDAGWILRIDADGDAGDCMGTDIMLNPVARTLTAVNASFTNVNRTNTALTVLSPVVQTASQSCCGPEICDNGIDDDGDGLTDCDDPDCALFVDCLSCTGLGTNGSGDTTWQVVTPETGYNRAIAIHYTGSNQEFTVPAGVTSLNVKAWGAGGGGGTVGNGTQGGGAGYAAGDASVMGGDVLILIVGEAGKTSSSLTTYGGGGAGGTDPDEAKEGASGGGRSAIQELGTDLLTAAGGGGGPSGNAFGVPTNAGAGGGLTGSNAMVNGGSGGSQVSGGAGGTNAGNPGNSGNQYTGGNGADGIAGTSDPGGGGGGGYYGGGGGNSQTVVCTDFTCQDTGGGGGSSYIGGVASGTTLAGSSINPANTVDVHYIAGIGIGGTVGIDGGNGLLIIQWNDPTLTALDLCVPTLVADTISTTGTMAIDIPVLTNDTFPTGVDTSSLMICASDGPDMGTAMANANGTITYTPDSNATFMDTLCYVVCDTLSPQNCDSAQVVVAVTIQPEICNNGIDDDGDGDIDCADSECAGSGVEICGDGIDNDCDGLADCFDTDCSTTMPCDSFQNNCVVGASGGPPFPRIIGTDGAYRLKSATFSEFVVPAAADYGVLRSYAITNSGASSGIDENKNESWVLIDFTASTTSGMYTNQYNQSTNNTNMNYYWEDHAFGTDVSSSAVGTDLVNHINNTNYPTYTLTGNIFRITESSPYASTMETVFYVEYYSRNVSMNLLSTAVTTRNRQTAAYTDVTIPTGTDYIKINKFGSQNNNTTNPSVEGHAAAQAVIDVTAGTVSGVDWLTIGTPGNLQSAFYFGNQALGSPITNDLGHSDLNSDSLTFTISGNTLSISSPSNHNNILHGTMHLEFFEANSVEVEGQMDFQGLATESTAANTNMGFSLDADYHLSYANFMQRMYALNLPSSTVDNEDYRYIFGAIDVIHNNKSAATGFNGGSGNDPCLAFDGASLDIDIAASHKVGYEPRQGFHIIDSITIIEDSIYWTVPNVPNTAGVVYPTISGLLTFSQKNDVQLADITVMEACDSLNIAVRICNTGEKVFNLKNYPITVYNGDPQASGATLLNTFNLADTSVLVGNCHDVSLGKIERTVTVAFDIYAVIGDDGSATLPITIPTDFPIPTNPTTQLTECDYANNFNNVAISACVEICDNGIDDDGDGLIDCNDPDCATSTDCFDCAASGTAGSGDTTWQVVTPETGYNRAIAFRTTGFDQTFIVPAGVDSVKVKAWGAGGGTNDPNLAIGGVGGYTEGVLSVASGNNLTFVVGEGGNLNTLNGGAAFGTVAYGFGGRGSRRICPDLGWFVSGGGGLTGVFSETNLVVATDTARALLIAGGGGAGETQQNVSSGCSPNVGSIVNSDGEPGNGSGGEATMRGDYPPQHGVRDVGGGGAGYKGGSSTAGNGATIVPGTANGGSGYMPTGGMMLSGTFEDKIPPNNSDMHYITGVGTTGTNTGGNGLLILQWYDPNLTALDLCIPTLVEDTISTTGTMAINIPILTNDTFPTGVDTSSLMICASDTADMGAAMVNANGTITYTPDSNATFMDTLCYVVCDTLSPQNCDSAQVIVTVNAVNDTPTIVQPPISLPEDSMLTFCPTVSDPDTGDTLTVSICGMPDEGIASSNDTCVTYTPAANFTGPDTVCVVVCDAGGLCDSVLVPITVTPVNDAPVAVDDPVSTDEDTPVVVDVQDNDSDEDGNPLTTSIIGTSTQGVTPTVVNGDSISYTPPMNFVGKDTLTYRVCDTGSPTLCDTALVVITVNSVNDTPTIIQPPIVLPEDSMLTFCPTVSDPDTGDTLTVSICGMPDEGIASSNDTCVTYTPVANFTGPDTVCVVVCDAGGLCDSVLVPITVTPVNDAPVAVDDSVSTDEDTPLTVNVLSNDNDQDGSLLGDSVRVITNPKNGTVLDNGDSTLTYTPTANFTGLDSIQYEICDTSALGSLCDTALVVITINSVNDTPTIIQPPIVLPEDSMLTFCPTVSDPDTGDTLTVSICGMPDEGIASSNDTCVTYTPAANFTGPDTVCVVVCDAGGLCDSILVPITVTPVNDTPTIIQPPIVLPEDSMLTFCPIVSDPDTGDTLTVSICGMPDEGIASSNDTCVTYTPAANFTGPDTVCVVVCDAGGLCDSILVPITVTPVNDTPTIVQPPIVFTRRQHVNLLSDRI